LKYVQSEKHLPSIPSAADIKEKGLNLGEFQMKLLQKIEELTLYTMEQARGNREQKAMLERKDAEIATLSARIAELEKKLDRIIGNEKK
jgi:hypothetical protein